MFKYSDPNNYMSGVQTGTTPTLTPTTIHSIEQAFIDLGAVTPGGRPNTQQSLNYQSGGFVPPLVEPAGMVKQEYVDYGYMEDESSSDGDWVPTPAKKSRANGGEAPSYRDSLPGYNAVTSSTGRKLPGPRRSRNEQLPPEEDRKRQVRRQRNKMAAAKCRQRRVDQTNTLLNETDGLEEEKGNLENEIQSLQQQKEQLEFLLEAHKPICNVAKGRIDNTASRNSVKAEPSLELKPFASLPRPSQLNGGSRPSTLPIQSKVTTPNVTAATGITISTPSGGIYATFGLDSMVDGHTGLTPITGAPSCSTQMHRNSSDSSPSDNLSPTTLMAL